MQNKWLLQSNIWNEYGYTRFIESVGNNSIDHEVVDVIPFTETFKQDIDYTPTQVFGSGRFINICRAKGFPTFKSFNPIEPFYAASSWVNGDGHDMKWGEIPKMGLEYPCFIKPYTEKFFTGMVFESPGDHDKVQLATSFIDDESEEIVRVSRVHDIAEEIRFYIIGGTIVSGSCYKVTRVPKQYRVDNSHPAWQACKDIVSTGVIDDAFVMDLGRTGDTWKIVELNNINSAGLYETDTDAIVSALKHL
ncbi:MAG: ATP-grasp domain-containing protein [Prosthecobacter sp.]